MRDADDVADNNDTEEDIPDDGHGVELLSDGVELLSGVVMAQQQGNDNKNGNKNDENPSLYSAWRTRQVARDYSWPDENEQVVMASLGNHEASATTATDKEHGSSASAAGSSSLVELLELESSFGTSIASNNNNNNPTIVLPENTTTQHDHNKPSTMLCLSNVLAFVLDWAYSLYVGFLVVSYWRGTWTLLDIWTCHQPDTSTMVNGQVLCFVGLFNDDEHLSTMRHKSAWHVLVAGHGLLLVAFWAMNQGFWQPGTVRAFLHLHDPSARSLSSRSLQSSLDTNSKAFQVSTSKTALRFAIIYLLGNGTVCIWRGIWYLLDAHVSPDNALRSYWTTSTAGLGMCMALCASASVLAPPAIFLLDGPSRSAPPLTSTILMSYRSVTMPVGQADVLNEQDSTLVVILDMMVSYLVLPWGVVGFWRGFWALMDHFLWGFTDSDKDFQLSILYSLFLGWFLLFMASDDIVQFIHTDKQKSTVSSTIVSECISRCRTVILAMGVVNVWRANWYLWDEWLGGTSVWSAALSHGLGVVLLFLSGCMSCITAPPSTLGVDAVAHPNCADEPLFANIPVPNEALYFCAMGRSPDSILGPQRFASEQFLPPPVSLRLVSAIRNVDSCFNLQTRQDSISSGILTARHQSRKGSEFFRSR